MSWGLQTRFAQKYTLITSLPSKRNVKNGRNTNNMHLKNVFAYGELDFAIPFIYITPVIRQSL